MEKINKPNVKFKKNNRSPKTIKGSKNIGGPKLNKNSPANNKSEANPSKRSKPPSKSIEKRKASQESALKNLINEKVVRTWSQNLQLIIPGFSEKLFIKNCLPIDHLELKDRVKKISMALSSSLDHPYNQNLEYFSHLLDLQCLKGFELWPLSEYVAREGLEDPLESLHFLKKLTVYFTSEFAVRPFLKKHPELTLKFLADMTKSENSHHRRWASEGSRPTLPWGEKLHFIMEDPSLTQSILEALKNDPELYVRKSVANHLNDFSKHQSDFVIETLKRWRKEFNSQEMAEFKNQNRNHKQIENRNKELNENQNKNRTENHYWLCRQALRTLIKKGDPRALALVGVFQNHKLKLTHQSCKPEKVGMGGHLEMKIQIQSQEKKSITCLVDYAFYFKKANGSHSKKVFKGKKLQLNPGETILMVKKHHLKNISTMQFYPGEQYLTFVVNGLETQKIKWVLQG